MDSLHAGTIIPIDHCVDVSELVKTTHSQGLFLEIFPTLNGDNGIGGFIAKPATLEDTWNGGYCLDSYLLNTVLLSAISYTRTFPGKTGIST